MKEAFVVKNIEKFIVYYNFKDQYYFNFEVKMLHKDENNTKNNFDYDILESKNYKITIYKTRCEFDIIFNKKGKYELELSIAYKKLIYHLTKPEDSEEQLEFTQEEKDKVFVESLKNILGLEYTNINKEKPIIKNMESFIFKPIVKVKELCLSFLEEPKKKSHYYDKVKETLINK